MANKTYRVGIVGLSGIAAGSPGSDDGPLRDEIMVGHTACLAQTPGVDVVGVCDLSSEMLDKFAATWGDRWPNATPYTDHREMVDTEGLDILTVATGDDKHADIAVYGANNGVGGVFVEKPLATTMEDANRMIAAFEANGVASSVGHTRRWRPLYHRARSVIRDGAIGPLRNIVATHGGRRAMTFRNGTHVIDGICFFADSEPAQVFAKLEEGFDHWDRYRATAASCPRTSRESAASSSSATASAPTTPRIRTRWTAPRWSWPAPAGRCCSASTIPRSSCGQAGRTERRRSSPRHWRRSTTGRTPTSPRTWR